MQEVVSHQIAFPLQQTTLQPAIPSNTRLSKLRVLIDFSGPCRAGELGTFWKQGGLEQVEERSLHITPDKTGNRT